VLHFIDVGGEKKIEYLCMWNSKVKPKQLCMLPPNIAIIWLRHN